MLKENIDSLYISIDSIHKDLYCKIRGVGGEQYRRVMDNLRMVAEHKMNR
jgi:MoaA/NifB/PqqE/SkfB family radical SAM enzyme